MVRFPLALCWVLVSFRLLAQTPSPAVRVLSEEVSAGRVVGAQLLSGSLRSRTAQAFHLGTIGLQDRRRVTDDTLFCIASCSKPFASAVVFRLLDQRKLALKTPASDLIPQMADLKLQDGSAVRSPTLRELLTHRGGIYSQHETPSADQLRAIRDFRLSIDDSVEVICRQKLHSKPGTKYAYSGAGYMLVGMMAQQATGSSFETLLQQNLCIPLKMKSTSYFPDPKHYPEIATGGKSGLVAPHTLGKESRLPLVGGSLYTTIHDAERFARMVLQHGRYGSEQVLSKTACAHFVSSPFEEQTYGYGWLLTKQNGNVVAVSHKGSLPPYQSVIRLNLKQGTYRIAFWTLSNPSDVATTKRVSNRVAQLLKL